MDEVEIISITEECGLEVDNVINKLKDTLSECIIIPPQIGDNTIIISDRRILGIVIEIDVNNWRCILKKENSLEVKHLVMQLPDGRVIRSDNNTITVEISSEIIEEKEIKIISDLDSIIEKFKNLKG